MNAFTLIEVLIVALIFSFLAIGITQVMNLGNVTFPVDLGQMQLQQQTRQAMQLMIQELRQASNPVISTGRITFDSFSGTGISYYLDTEDANGDGLTNQILRDPVGLRPIVANNITNLIFTPDDPLLIRLIRIDINAGLSVFKNGPVVLRKDLTFALVEQVRLRNE